MKKQTVGSVHDALKLSTAYKVAIAVEGNVDKHFHKVVTLLSDTAGQLAVYAEYTHIDGWVCVDKATFNYRSMQIVNSLRGKENCKHITEHGLEGRVPHAVHGANTVQDLDRYLGMNPHPFYRLASATACNSDFLLIWERKEFKA